MNGREPKLDDVLAAVHGLHTEGESSSISPFIEITTPFPFRSKLTYQAIAGFHDTVAPLLSRGDPQQTELLIKHGMEESALVCGHHLMPYS